MVCLVHCFVGKTFEFVVCLGGKCGICGEPYEKSVKLFEKGGAMYKGTIVKTYRQGQQIDVKVMVSIFRTHSRSRAIATDEFYAS